MAKQKPIVPAAFIPDVNSFLEEAVGTSKTSLHEARIAIWFFWCRPDTKKQFREAADDEQKLSALRELACQYIKKKVKAYWWSQKFGEISFGSLTPEETEEESSWQEFWGILAPNPEEDDRYDAEFHWGRYWELKKEILGLLARVEVETRFGGQEGNGVVHPYERDWKILERRACGWSFGRIAEDVGLSPDKVSKRFKELGKLLWQELSEEWLPARFRQAEDESEAEEQFSVEDLFKPPKVQKAAEAPDPHQKKKISLTAEEMQMSGPQLLVALKEKYGVEFYRTSVFRIKDRGYFYLNYHRSFIVDMLENYRQRRDEEKGSVIGQALREQALEKLESEKCVRERVVIPVEDEGLGCAELGRKYGFSTSHIWYVKKRQKQEGGPLYVLRNFYGATATKLLSLKHEGPVVTLQEFRKSPKLQEEVCDIFAMEGPCGLPARHSRERAQQVVDLLLEFASGYSIEEAAQRAGYAKHSSAASDICRARKQLLGFVHIPHATTVHDSWILEALADGMDIKKVAFRVYRGQKSKEEFSAKDMENFKYLRLKRIKRERGL